MTEAKECTAFSSLLSVQERAVSREHSADPPQGSHQVCNELRLSWLGICGKHPPFWNYRICTTRWRTATCELHVSFKILYIRGSITNCAGSNGISRNIVTMKVIVTLDRARPSAGNIEGWEWSAVRLATVWVTEPSLQQQLSKVRHYQLHRAWTDTDTVYSVHKA